MTFVAATFHEADYQSLLAEFFQRRQQIILEEIVTFSEPNAN